MIADNLAQMIEMNAVRRAGRVALADGDRRLTYAELGAEMRRSAGFLQARGVGRGDVVGLTMRDGIDYVVTMIAILRLGAVLLPLDVRWTDVEKENVARLFGASHVVTDGAPLQIQGVAVIAWSADEAGRDYPSATFPDDVSPDEPMLLSLSSGTTGNPKGPLLSHRQMMLRLWAEWICLGFSQDDVHLCATPLYFGGGRGFTLSHLCGGATVAFCPAPYRPADVAAAIERHGATTTFLVPTLLRRIADAPQAARDVVKSLRFVISSGSALHPAERTDMAKNVNAHIINYYASTEGGGVSVLEASAANEKTGSVGRAILGSQLAIADEAGQLLPQGEIGHIRQRAPWHPAGFHRNESETQRYFRDGWYLPGDLGYLDADGYLFITGRAKDMIIRGGINIYPNEIEAVLISHPAISDAAVVGRPSAMFGEEVTAFLVPADDAGAATSEDAIALHCRGKLAPYKIPSQFRFVDALPRNSGGKVLKAELVARLSEA